MESEINLRKLNEKDADGMYEWMHEKDIGKAFKKDMSSKTMEDVLNFIQASQQTESNLNFAICDKNDEYLGTISLKNIDLNNKNAEYAIVLRKVARGKGVAEAATRLLIDYAFKELDLKEVYLNVLADNKRAISLYTKCGFLYDRETEEVFEKYGEKRRLRWFSIKRAV